jgi:hypothetical protein
MLKDVSARGWLLLVLVIGEAGCAGFMDAAIPQSKVNFMKMGLPTAAFDLQCDKEKIEVTELGDSSMGVRGCGKSGRYKYVPNVGWVLNGSIQ